MMRGCRGFSLIEALASALVLAIGLLGLGQLQARLSLAARQDAETVYAALLLTEFYERAATPARLAPPGRPSGASHRAGPSARYTINTSLRVLQHTRQARIEVRWMTPDGDRRITITGLFAAAGHPFDARWLLTGY